MYVSSQELASRFSLKLDFGYFPLTTLRYPLIGIIFYILTIVLFKPNQKDVNTISTTSQADVKKTTTLNNNKTITPGGENDNSTKTNSKNNANKNTNAVTNKKDESIKTCKELSTSDTLMFFHNAILCIFSLLCFVNTAPIAKRLWNNGWETAVCQQWSLEYSNVYGFWSYLFYLSKFYEFVDTWIVMFKGRKPIFLQTFHHVGAVVGMWLCLASKSTGGYIFVVENSFIHTIMYFYYAVSILGYKPKFKYIITVLQMVQFVVGNSIAVLQICIYRSCMTWEDKATILYHIIYTTILLVLFRKFYKDAYKKKNV